MKINAAIIFAILRKASIIGSIEKSGAADLHYIGKIDKEIYSCVTSDITTDEVIITDERIAHIKERHPNDYEVYCGYMSQMIDSPDYIVEANKPNTAVLLKSFEQDDEKFKLILKIKTCSEPDSYRNSVISFWKIGDTTWNKLLKNKKVLYKL